MKQRKGFSMLSIFIILFVVFIGGIIYFYLKSSSQVLSKETRITNNEKPSQNLRKFIHSKENISAENQSANLNKTVNNTCKVIASKYDSLNSLSFQMPKFSRELAKEITSCDSISGSGYYILNRDLNVHGNGCFDLKNLQEVFINCQGHSVILDQENKELTEGRKPLLGLKNVKNFSIESCNMKVINPSQAPSTIVILENSDGIIYKNTFYDPNVISNGVDDFSIVIDHSKNIRFSDNIVYSVYEQRYTDNNIIENNIFLPSLKTLKQLTNVVTLSHGSGSSIINNRMDGKWDGSDYSLQVGADEGISIIDESDDLIKDNLIENNWDCGIESTGLIENTKIIGNAIKKSGVCGVGAWYWNSWKGNEVSNNIIDSAPKMFYFFRNYGLRPQESYVYFIDNVFNNNTFLNPTSDISSIFSFHGETGGRSELEEGPITFQPYIAIAKNNLFANNKFNKNMRAPLFAPVELAVDGGCNICGEIAVGDYPNIIDFPLKCK